MLAAVGDIDKLIDPKAKGEQAMLIKYLGSTEEKIEKLLDYPELLPHLSSETARKPQ